MDHAVNGCQSGTMLLPPMLCTLTIVQAISDVTRLACKLATYDCAKLVTSSLQSSGINDMKACHACPQVPPSFRALQGVSTGPKPSSSTFAAAYTSKGCSIACTMSSSEEDTPGTTGPAALQLLQAHGELFMSMFDDHDDKKRYKKQVEAKKQETQPAAAARAALSVKLPAQPSNGGKKQKPGACKPGAQQPEVSTGGAGMQSKQHQKAGSKRPHDDIEEILFAHKSRKQDKPQKAAAVNVAAAASVAARERKLFMSSKAGKVHEAAAVLPTSQTLVAEADDEAQLTPQQFKALQMEVERLGASGLDRKERKKWQAAMLQRLGAKADKSPRMPARMGLGIASATKVREARKLEEAIQTGMLKRKGIGKAKKLQHERSRDHGLNELGRSFKAGVLRVKHKPKSSAGVNPVRAGGGKGGKGGKKGKGKSSGLRLPF